MSLYEHMIMSNHNFNRDFDKVLFNAISALPKDTFIDAVLSNMKQMDKELPLAA